MTSNDIFLLALEQEHGVTFLADFDREQVVEILEEEETSNEDKATEICDLLNLDNYVHFSDILILLENL